MILRTLAKACCVVLVVSWCVAYAAQCPLCLKQIPEGEKFCEQHKAEMLARRASANEEKERLDAVIRARAMYMATVQDAVSFYEERGDAEGLRRSRAELADLRAARKLSHQNWENALPNLSASEADPEADKLLAEADELRKKWNPLKRGANRRAAVPKYREVLENHPNSTAVDSAAFGLGEVLSSGAMKEYRRAVTLYELAYIADQNTPHETLYRAARVCDEELADYEEASRFYWLASQKGVSVITRKKAAMRLKQLQKQGYGSDYGVVEVETEADEPEPE